MCEENRKEILRRENIKSDIKDACIDDIKIVSFKYLPLFVLSLLFLILTIMADVEIGAILSISVLWLIITFTWLFFTYKALKLICKTNKNDFKIVIDSLCGREEKRSIDKFFAYEHHIRLALNRPYRLFFVNYGEYQIPKKQNYRWSFMNSMKAKDIYNSAVTKDEYYLAVVDNKEIVLAYNTKLFELQE